MKDDSGVKRIIQKEVTYSQFQLQNTPATKIERRLQKRLKKTEIECRLQERLKKEKHKIGKLKQSQEKTLQDLHETNNAIGLLAKQMEKNTQEKGLHIARQLERKVLPLCCHLKEEGKKKEMLHLEVDILIFQIKALIGELTHGSNLMSLLSPSEMHISALIAKGVTSQQIANQLFISDSTVKTHRKNIRTKLGLKNKKTNLARYLIDIM